MIFSQEKNQPLQNAGCVRVETYWFYQTIDGIYISQNANYYIIIAIYL